MEALSEAEIAAIACTMRTGQDAAAFALQGNPQLKVALEIAAGCEQHIEPEQARIRHLLSLAQSDTEREAREFQLDYIETYLTRAAALARKRLEHFHNSLI